MNNWKTEDPGSLAFTFLTERLDTAIRKLKEGRRDVVRALIFVRPTQVQTEGVPVDVLTEVSALTDKAHAALSLWPPDTRMALQSLKSARVLLG